MRNKTERTPSLLYLWRGKTSVYPCWSSKPLRRHSMGWPEDRSMNVTNGREWKTVSTLSWPLSITPRVSHLLPKKSSMCGTHPPSRIPSLLSFPSHYGLSGVLPNPRRPSSPSKGPLTVTNFWFLDCYKLFFYETYLRLSLRDFIWRLRILVLL